MKNKSSKISSITQTIKFITGILSWVVLVILVLIAAFLLYYFVSVKIYAQKGENYRPFLSLYTIVTPSMVPNINPNDVIIDVAVSKPEDIKVGDVITFISTATLTKGMTITHRVDSIREEDGEIVYVTKGDANISPDGAPAKFTNVLGKVLIRIPKLGLLQHFLSTKGGWLIVVVIPALFVIISDVLKIFRLTTAKNKVQNQLNTEKLEKEIQTKEKEITEKTLEDKYRPKRKPTDRDPIPKTSYAVFSTKVRGPKISTDDLPKKIELPKLKETKEKVKKERKNNKGKGKKRKKN